MMQTITATGCSVTAVIASFVAMDPANVFEATVCALSIFGLAGELGMEMAKGPASLRMHLIDSLYGLDEQTVSSRVSIVQLIYVEHTKIKPDEKTQPDIPSIDAKNTNESSDESTDESDEEPQQKIAKVPSTGPTSKPNAKVGGKDSSEDDDDDDGSEDSSDEDYVMDQDPEVELKKMMKNEPCAVLSNFEQLKEPFCRLDPFFCELDGLLGGWNVCDMLIFYVCNKM